MSIGGIHEKIISALKNVYVNVQNDPNVIQAKATGDKNKIAIAKAAAYKKALDPNDVVCPMFYTGKST